MLNDTENEITNPKKINGIIYLENDKFDDLFELIKIGYNFVIQAIYDFDVNSCDLLLLSKSPIGKEFKNLNQQTYILSPDGLYFVSNLSENISKENLVTLPQRVTIKYLWEMLEEQKQFIDQGPRKMDFEQNCVIKETKHQIAERVIGGFKILGNYIAQWHLEKTIPEPDNLILSCSKS